VLRRTRDKLSQAANTIAAAETRTRQMDRALKSVEALSEARALEMLPALRDADPGAPLA
jgi:DNA recombination protein RmuC